MKSLVSKKPFDLLVTALMFVFATLYLIPLVWMIRTAFAPSQAILDMFSWFTPTLDTINYIWQSATFGIYYRNTILLVLSVLVVQFVTITLAGYAFGRMEFYGKNFLFTLFLAQLMIGGDILLLPNYGLISDLGLINTLLGVMLPSFSSALGILMMRQTIKTIPYELEEAAKIDGCGQGRILFRIYVPLLRPAYLAFGMISASWQWNNFMWPLIVINSPEKRLLTTGLAIFAKAAEVSAQWDNICAATLIVTAPLLILFLVFQRQFIESFAHSGIK